MSDSLDVVINTLSRASMTFVMTLKESAIGAYYGSIALTMLTMLAWNLLIFPSRFLALSWEFCSKVSLMKGFDSGLASLVKLN